MQIFKSLSGMAEGELTGADIAATLDAIAEAGIVLFHVQWIDEVSIRFSVARKDYRKLKELTQRRGESLRLLGRTGLYWWGKMALGRPVLMVGMLFFLMLILYLPSRVLFVQVEGNISVPSRRILEAAENCGISFGASRREVRSERVKNALLQNVPELQWAGVNTYGCVAVISVRERSVTEQVEETKGVCSIVAAQNGIVMACTATEGNLLCRPGQAVLEGEVLISGYTDCGITIQATRAAGEVYAQTVRELTLISPLDYACKEETGEIRHRYSLILGKKRINLWKDSGIWDTSCGRIYEEYYVTLPGGFQLPIALAVESYVIYEPMVQWLEEPENSARITFFASDYVRQQMIAGTIDEEFVSVGYADGYAVLTGKYICTEMIGKVQWEQIGEYHGEND